MDEPFATAEAGEAGGAVVAAAPLAAPSAAAPSLARISRIEISRTTLRIAVESEPSSPRASTTSMSWP